MEGSMRALRRVASLLALLATVVCAGIPVDVDYDPAADFSGYRTFAWLVPENPPTGHPALDNPLLAERIRSAIEGELRARGYAAAAPSRADFRVGFQITLQQKLDAYTVDHYYGYAPRWGPIYVPETVVHTYDEGTLVVDIVDARQRRLVWRGWTSQRVYAKPSPEESERIIREVVAAIFERFPPQPEGGAG
jgi:hypothetical protein